MCSATRERLGLALHRRSGVTRGLGDEHAIHKWIRALCDAGASGARVTPQERCNEGHEDEGLTQERRTVGVNGAARGWTRRCVAMGVNIGFRRFLWTQIILRPW